MAQVKKIDILSAAKMLGGIMGLLGLGAGIFYSFGGFIIDLLVSLGWFTSAETPGLSLGTILAFGALIGMPIIFAIPGLFVGALGALLYNLSAKWFGGTEIDLEQ